MRKTVNVLAEINAQLIDIGEEGKVCVDAKGEHKEQILGLMLSLVESVLNETGETKDYFCRALVGKSIEDMLQEDINSGLFDKVCGDEEKDNAMFREHMQKLDDEMKDDGIKMEIHPLNDSEDDEDFIKGMELLSKAFEKRRK